MLVILPPCYNRFFNLQTFDTQKNHNSEEGRIAVADLLPLKMNTRVLCQWPCHVRNTRSDLNNEVKQRGAKVVVGSVTAWPILLGLRTVRI